MNPDDIDQLRSMHAGGMLIVLFLAALFAPDIARFFGIY